MLQWIFTVPIVIFTIISLWICNWEKPVKIPDVLITMVPLHLSMAATVPTGRQLHAAIADHFAAIPDGFVEVAPYVEAERLPELNPEIYNNTNRMRLHVFANDAKAQATLVAVYDNLGKGASGAAVQNLNLMLGLDEGAGL